MDCIFIKDLEISGKHGVMAHEHFHEQRFSIDIEAYFDTQKSAATDKLSDSVSYVDLANAARTVIEDEPMYLVERIAQRIADAILEETRITKVRITIRKPSVLPSGVPGVTIERSQEESS